MTTPRRAHPSPVPAAATAAKGAPPLRILMVCLGNICRSPTAEGVLRDRLRSAGLDRGVEVDSAGTYGGHAGRPPDRRAIAHARRRGVDIAQLRARRVIEADFLRFDRIYAMDADNLAELQSMQPAGSRAEVALLMSVVTSTAAPGRRGAREVPDPYTGGPDDFEHVLDLVERAADAIVAALGSRGP